jgi:hypothetical protein
MLKRTSALICNIYREEEMNDYQSALAELVACKRLQNRFKARTDFRPPGTYEIHQAEVDEHRRREPAAWAAAFALVDEGPTP